MLAAWLLQRRRAAGGCQAMVSSFPIGRLAIIWASFPPSSHYILTSNPRQLDSPSPVYNQSPRRFHTNNTMATRYSLSTQSSSWITSVQRLSVPGILSLKYPGDGLVTDGPHPRQISSFDSSALGSPFDPGLGHFHVSVKILFLFVSGHSKLTLLPYLT
ncbi:hypothetical protein DFH09DRAFT_1315670 [Mycena vulgaris]|nr:hypothetical protein DFH09DRAFT_1315670 [Mycena vulgaris]